MNKVSDIEADFNEENKFVLPTDRLLRVRVPQIKLATTKPGELPSSYTNRFVRADIPDASAVELCLNRQECSEKLTVLCQWQPAEASAGEYDIQITLDPELFDKPDKRVLWTSAGLRKKVTDPLCNFYSSRLAGQSDTPATGPSFTFEIPRDVMKSLYFDFECTPETKDVFGTAMPRSDVQRAAAEWNLRSLTVYIRVLIKEQIAGVSLVLPSDLESFASATLLGFFNIAGPPNGNKGTRVRKVTIPDKQVKSGVRVIDESHEPEAVIIHVWDVASFKNARPHFSGGLSAHYAVDGEGRIWWYVNEHELAYHAGYVTDDVQAAWTLYKKNGRYGKDGKWHSTEDYKKGDVNPNYDTIGIEHEGRADSVWPVRKYAATGWLLQDIYARWPRIEISDQRILRHNNFNRQKSCPGNTVDLDYLRRIATGYRARSRSRATEVSLGSNAPSYE